MIVGPSDTAAEEADVPEGSTDLDAEGLETISAGGVG
jgi:hypothetical protein